MVFGERMRNLISSPTLVGENGREETGNRNLISSNKVEQQTLVKEMYSVTAIQRIKEPVCFR